MNHIKKFEGFMDRIFSKDPKKILSDNYNKVADKYELVDGEYPGSNTSTKIYWELQDILEKETGLGHEECNAVLKKWMKEYHNDVFNAEGNAP